MEIFRVGFFFFCIMTNTMLQNGSEENISLEPCHSMQDYAKYIYTHLHEHNTHTRIYTNSYVHLNHTLAAVLHKQLYSPTQYCNQAFHRHVPEIIPL